MKLRNALLLACSLIPQPAFAADPMVTLINDVKSISADIRAIGGGNALSYTLNNCQLYSNCKIDELWVPVANAQVSGCMCSPIPLALAVPKIREAVIEKIMTRANIARDPNRAQRLWTFSDVPETDVIAPYSRLTALYGIMMGYVANQSQGILGVNDPLTREQAYISLNRRFGLVTTTDSNVLYQTYKSYLSGCADGSDKFCPADPVSRGEFAHALASTLGWDLTRAQTMPVVFGDVQTSTVINGKKIFPAAQLFGDQLIKFSVGYGFNPTLNYTVFGPRDNITRGQAAVFFARSLFPSLAPGAVIPGGGSGSGGSSNGGGNGNSSAPSAPLAAAIHGYLTVEDGNGKYRRLGIEAHQTAQFTPALTGNNVPVGYLSGTGILTDKLYFTISNIVSGNYEISILSKPYVFTPKTLNIGPGQNAIDFTARCASGYTFVDRNPFAVCQNTSASADNLNSGIGSTALLTVAGCNAITPCKVENISNAAKAARAGSFLSYQWYKNGNKIEGATSSTYAIKVDAKDDLSSFTATISDGENENTAIPLVIDVKKVGPQFVINLPARISLANNASGKLEVAINDTATQPLKYVWSVKYAGQSQFQNIGKGSSLKLKGVKKLNGAQFKVLVSNTAGKVSSKITKVKVR